MIVTGNRNQELRKSSFLTTVALVAGESFLYPGVKVAGRGKKMMMRW